MDTSATGRLSGERVLDVSCGEVGVLSAAALVENGGCELWGLQKRCESIRVAHSPYSWAIAEHDKDNVQTCWFIDATK